MKKIIGIITVGLLLCMATACGERQPPEPEISEPQPEAGQSEVSAADGGSEAALPEGTVAVTLPLAGPNAHTTDASIYLPEAWSVNPVASTVTADGRVMVHFGIVSKLDISTEEVDDSHFEWRKGELEESGGLMAAHVLDIPGLVGRYYYVNGWTVQADEEFHIEYHIMQGNRSVNLTFIPDPEADVETQRIEFETYLATFQFV